MQKNEMILLYALKPPFTDVTVKKVETDFSDIYIDIKHSHAGFLRVKRKDLKEILIQGFANTSRDVGFIHNGKVTWKVEPEQFGVETVIDQDGFLHDVFDLTRTLNGQE